VFSAVKKLQHHLNPKAKLSRGRYHIGGNLSGGFKHEPQHPFRSLGNSLVLLGELRVIILTDLIASFLVLNE